MQRSSQKYPRALSYDKEYNRLLVCNNKEKAFEYYIVWIKWHATWNRKKKCYGSMKCSMRNKTRKEKQHNVWFTQ